MPIVIDAPDKPIWAPLEKVASKEELSNYQFVGIATTSEGLQICLYKHSTSRNYLNIDLEGKCYKYNQDAYIPWSTREALEHSSH